MIIKGKSRATPSQLAAHLGNAEKNERVRLLETRGTIARDLRGALVEMDAYAAGTRCQKSLYHAAISPEPPHILTDEQRAEAIDALEARLGLDGHARVVVLHEKLGRQHIHVVWSRIDLIRMRSVSDGHNYRKHEEVARDLERRFGHDRVQGAHHERDGVERPDRTPSRAELRQEERTGIKGKEVKAEVAAAFEASDSPEALKAALAERGYILAKGDRRDFVVVDRAGGIHSLARRIDGIKAAELREFMKGLDRDRLPSTEEAREAIKERERIAREAGDEARAEKGYSSGADYVSQTRAAQKDHQARQQRLNAAKTPIEVDVAKLKRKERDDERARQRRATAQEATATNNRRRSSARDDGSGTANVEMTDAQRARLDRLLKGPGRHDRPAHREDEGPDRQNGAPGGGRTRGR